MVHKLQFGYWLKFIQLPHNLCDVSRKRKMVSLKKEVIIFWLKLVMVKTNYFSLEWHAPMYCSQYEEIVLILISSIFHSSLPLSNYKSGTEIHTLSTVEPDDSELQQKALNSHQKSFLPCWPHIRNVWSLILDQSSVSSVSAVICSVKSDCLCHSVQA